MNYWPAARWKIAIIEQGIERWIEPELPYALIGSHPCCTIQIAEPRVSPYVYFACCFADSVEVWPLCPIAFPRWGVTLPENSLAVGRKRISLFHQSHSLWPDIADRGGSTERKDTTPGLAQGVRREITLDWDGKQRPKTLARRVMILGGEHPSTLRLYGQDLAACDHAIVCVDASVWLINLKPDPENRDAAKLCRPLTSMSAPETVGNIKLRLGKVIEPREQPDSSVSKTGLSSLTAKPSPLQYSEKRTSEDRRSTGSSSKRRKPKGRKPKGRKPKRRKGDQSKKKRSSTSTSSRAKDSSKLPSNTASTTPEALTSKLTDQLVRIDHARFNRRRILIISTITVGFLTALAIVLWIIFVLLIPKINEMMG
ncbi:MAG: hypothetical protein GY904_00680 [Planctomycetaceae bacterium]|nr:hypothetical protein [Planctomycetaceae bacterium]